MSAEQVLEKITSNGWVAPGLATSGGMSALGAAIKPIDSLAAAGLGWLSTHVQPLQDVVDRMTGNALVIQTFADTWQRATEGIQAVQEDLSRSAAADTARWQGRGRERLPGQGGRDHDGVAGHRRARHRRRLGEQNHGRGGRGSPAGRR